MSKVLEMLCEERLELCGKLGRARVKLEEAQKEYDSIKAKLDLRDEMIDKLMEEEVPEGSYANRAEDVVGMLYFTKNGMEVVIMSYSSKDKRLIAVTREGNRQMLTFADIDWNTKHERGERTV